MKAKISLIGSTLLLMLTLSSCVVPASHYTIFKRESPPPNKAILYVYRPNLTVTQAAENPSVYVDKKLVKKNILRGKYCKVELAQGMHKVEVKHGFFGGSPGTEVDIQAESNKTYCVRYEDPVETINTPLGPKYKYISNLQIVPNDEALPELANTKRYQPKEN